MFQVDPEKPFNAVTERASEVLHVEDGGGGSLDRYGREAVPWGPSKLAKRSKCRYFCSQTPWKCPEGEACLFEHDEEKATRRLRSVTLARLRLYNARRRSEEVVARVVSLTRV